MPLRMKLVLGNLDKLNNVSQTTYLDTVYYSPISSSDYSRKKSKLWVRVILGSKGSVKARFLEIPVRKVLKGTKHGAL